MRVKHCPRCGSDEISKSSGSAEYSSWVRYSCEDCGWGYKKGSGMGTGSRSSGTHPRKASPNEQTTLDQSEYSASTPGEWCSTCDTCARPGLCRCVEDDQTGFCEDCAKYSEHDVDEMHEVATYWGRHSHHKNPYPCSICGEEKSEYKIT